MNYYNENDPYCAAWLRNLISAKLIPDGIVDDRDIRDVTPNDLASYLQCHFFAGIAGWPRALHLAGVSPDRPLWTGSCPCQPFSAAGARRGFADERHLWPFWYHLISQCKPAVIFGEQVAKAADWLALVHGDLEAVGYAVGAIPIEAACAQANHLRDRFWFIAHADGERQQERTQCNGGPLARQQPPLRHDPRGLRDDVANPYTPGSPERDQSQLLVQQPAAVGSSWWSVEPDVGRVAHGVSQRVAKLRALGNAIVPQVAAEFIKASL